MEPRQCNNKGCTNSTKLKICTRCKDVKYCSTECQKADWPVHKQICKKNDMEGIEMDIVSKALPNVSAADKLALRQRGTCFLVILHGQMTGSKMSTVKVATRVTQVQEAITLAKQTFASQYDISKMEQINNTLQEGCIHVIVLNDVKKIVTNYAL